MITRRTFLRQTGAGAALAALAPTQFSAAANAPDFPLTPAAEIEERVRQARPLFGGKIPADLADRLGATHYDGHYFLTQKPYLIEGAEAIQRLGMRVAKFWLREDKLAGYNYNSDWRIPPDARLVDVLRHEYFVAALALPFRTVVFEIFPLSQKPGAFLDIASDFADEEKQFYEVATHLLTAYRDRPVNFILQHWEGDWMLRGAAGAQWANTPPEELQRRCDGFIRWLAARQRGVTRARAAAGSTRCQVYHAAEVNRVWDGTKGIPTLTTHILPHVTLDLVSWSSYDGMKSAVAAWQGVELIRQHMRPSPVLGQRAVFIGEIGKPEQGVSPAALREWWDRAMGVFFALDIPWILQWELYCNEPKDGKKWDRRVRRAEELRGFWLIRPDGSLSHAANYLTSLLAHAGGSLPAAEWLPEGASK